VYASIFLSSDCAIDGLEPDWKVLSTFTNGHDPDRSSTVTECLNAPP
jgi:hypothetical protein